MAVLTSLFAGVLFGLGLLVSGMANPAKVLGFLDVAGQWDPSLGLVMGGAVAVASAFFALAGKRSRSLLGLEFRLPTRNDIDLRLVAGSVLFGIGWAMVGLCPGPALVVLGLGVPKGFSFVLAMLAGMVVFEVIEARTKARGTKPIEV